MKDYQKNINGCFYVENIQILKRDVDITCVPNEFSLSPLDTVIAEGKKEYENNYIWGQLVGWYKLNSFGTHVISTSLFNICIFST